MSGTFLDAKDTVVNKIASVCLCMCQCWRDNIEINQYILMIKSSCNLRNEVRSMCIM